MPFIADEEPLAGGFIADEEAIPNPAMPEPVNLGVPADTKQERLFQGINAGDITGLSSRKIFQGTAPILASIAIPELLVSAFPGLAPATATGVAGYLGRLGLLNLAGSAAGSVTAHAPDVLTGRETPMEAAKGVGLETAIGTAIPTIGGPILQKAGQAAFGGLAAASRAPSLLQAPQQFARGASVGALRPVFEATADAEARAAAEFIEQATGLKPARSMGEALGKTSIRGKSYLEIENELGEKAAGALKPEARNDIARAILYTATNLAGEAPTPATLAEATLAGIQEAIGTQISGPVRTAVQEISEKVSSGLGQTALATGQEAMRLTSPAVRATAAEAGGIGKLAAEDALKLFEETESGLYGAYRQRLGNLAPKGFLKNTKSEAESILGSGLKTTNKEGVETALASTVQDAPARTFLSQLSEAADTPQDLQAIRNYRTRIGETFGDDLLKSIGAKNKKRLYGALSKDIDALLDTLPDPEIKKALKAADLFRRENIDLFKSGMAEGAIEGVLEGGKTGQGLLNNVLGDTDRYNAFKSILGTQFGTFRDSARDYVLTKAQAKATGTLGDFSVGEALKQISAVPEEVAADLFPGLPQRLGDLDRKELQTSNLTKALPADPEKVLDWVSANRNDLIGFLGPGGDAKLADAIRLQAAERVRFHNAVLRDVASGKATEIAKNPVKFVESLMDGSYAKTGDVNEALRAAASYQPKVYEQIQREYLARLIGDSLIDGVISGESLASKLSKPVSGAAYKSAGKRLDMATEILGKAKVDSLRQVADSIGKTQKGLLGKAIKEQQTVLEFVANAETPMDAAVAIGSKAAAARTGARAGARILNKTPQWKYRLAAYLANDPETLALLSKPISRLNGAEASLLLNAIMGQEIREE